MCDNYFRIQRALLSLQREVRRKSSSKYVRFERKPRHCFSMRNNRIIELATQPKKFRKLVSKKVESSSRAKFKKQHRRLVASCQRHLAGYNALGVIKFYRRPGQSLCSSPTSFFKPTVLFIYSSYSVESLQASRFFFLEFRRRLTATHVVFRVVAATAHFSGLRRCRVVDGDDFSMRFFGISAIR